MLEASKNEYFVDGFLIKYFNVYPIGFDKNNLFDEQKIFLVYLMGSIPTLDNWALQVDYKNRLEEIKNLKKAEISKTDIDLAILHGNDIEELKRERLIQEKEKRLRELNEEFGIKEEVKELPKIEGIPEIEEVDETVQRTNKEELWEMLELKGLIKK